MAESQEKPDLVCGRPNFDVATRWGAEWNRLMVKVPAEEKGLTVRDLLGILARKVHYVKALDDGAIYVSAVGHGSPKLFTGQMQAVVFWVDDEETARVAKDKHFNFLSCSMGQELAPYLCDSGAVGVHAYTNVYTFYVDHGDFPDGSATPFFRSHHETDVQLLDGVTHGEAHKACKAKYQEFLDDPGTPEFLKGYLFADMNGKMFCGNPSARIFFRLVEGWLQAAFSSQGPGMKFSLSRMEVGFGSGEEVLGFTSMRPGMGFEGKRGE